MDISWIKLKVDMFSDEKIQIIQQLPSGDTILVIWLQLLTLAGKCNSDGILLLTNSIYYTPEMLASVFHRNVTEINMAITTLAQFEMIEYTDDGAICISNFNKHQNLDSMEKIREQNRLRKQQQRERNKQQNLIMSRDMSRDVTQQNKNKNKEIDIDTNVSIAEKPDTIVDDLSPTTTAEEIDYNNILEIFNSVCHDLPRIRAITEERKRKIKTAVKFLEKNNLLEDKLDIYSKFKHIFLTVNDSDFLSGRNTSQWNGCSFDWILNTTNLTKIIEGNYSNDNSKLKKTTTPNNNNKFNNFSQRKYTEAEMDELERRLLSK